MRQRPTLGPLTFGVLNGLLPCGLLYATLGAAAGLGSLAGAMAFAGAFGAGTLAVFVVITASANQAAHWLPARARRLAPLAVALVGALLIARGALPMAHGAMSAHGSTPMTGSMSGH